MELESMSSQNHSMKEELEDLEEEARMVETVEDACIVIEAAEELLPRLFNARAQQRAEKILRQVKARRPLLPSDDNFKSSRKEMAVQGSAPDCPRCGTRMRLRTGDFTPFFGCSEYPNCFGKKNLTKKQLDGLQ